MPWSWYYYYSHLMDEEIEAPRVSDRQWVCLQNHYSGYSHKEGSQLELNLMVSYQFSSCWRFFFWIREGISGCKIQQRRLCVEQEEFVLLNSLFKKVYSRDTYTKMFTAVLFKMRKNWKRSKCPKLKKTVDEGMLKRWHMMQMLKIIFHLPHRNICQSSIGHMCTIQM